MNISQLVTTIDLKIKTNKTVYFKAYGLDFDLLLSQVSRLVEQYGPLVSIELSELAFGSAKVRSSLYIQTLGDLHAFIENLNSYSLLNPQLETLQVVSMYVGCYDHSYHHTSPTSVINEIPDIIFGCYHRKNKPKLINRNYRTTEIAENWIVLTT